ncbi:MAG: patatin-like phospholipase family protein [Rhizomicrobium sp.]
MAGENENPDQTFPNSLPRWGGAKGFYSLGVLREIEGLVGCRLWEKFDLIFGTSTGAIIAALLALGHTADEVHDLYKEHVVAIMERKSASAKSGALSELARAVFQDRKFDAFKTGVGIVPRSG